MTFGVQAPDQELPIVNLRPTELFVAKEPTRIVTILGSCVAVCLHDRRRRVGAMCHGFLPRMRVHSEADECSRFVDCAIHYMVQELIEHCGASLRDMEAKLVGGARTFMVGAASGSHVGPQNIQVAREVIQQYGLPVTLEEVGCTGGYKLFFDSHTGEVRWRQLGSGKKSGAGGRR